MKRLIEFLVAFKHWFVFIILMSLSLGLLLSDGLYRNMIRRQALSWAFGHMQEWMTEANTYASLREKNIQLLQENARIEHALQQMNRQFRDAIVDSTKPALAIDSLPVSLPHFLIARIVNIPTRLGAIYYIVNKGSKDGVIRDMAVMSAQGVVGAVMEVSDNYSIVIPIINPKLKLSCRVKSSGYRGTLSTNGMENEANLGGLPLHATVNKGDTILTSGASYIFSEGLPVGVVERAEENKGKGAGGAFGNYRIRLMTNFEQLDYVYIVLDPPMKEAKELELKALPTNE